MECGLTNQIYGPLYEELFSPDSSDNVIVNAKFPEPTEIIDAIHEAGGIAVLAHPDMFDSYDLIDELIEHGLDGIEVWHPSCDEECQSRLKAIAEEHGLLMTGGSDFHGMYTKSSASLGDITTPPDQLRKLLTYKSRKRRAEQAAAAAVEEETVATK
jgi:hypothetical protein